MAVVENVSAFSPASDVILAASMVTRTAEVLRHAKQSLRVVRTAFWISAAYNRWAWRLPQAGKLSPVVCAILMPVVRSPWWRLRGRGNWFGRRTLGKTEVRS